VTSFTGRAIEAMLNYGWPGNIREMENLVERGVILAPDGGAIDISRLFTSGETIDAEMFRLGTNGALMPTGSLLDQIASTPDGEIERVARKVNSLLMGISGDIKPASLDELDDIETALLKSAVQRAQGNLSAAARMLGMTRPQLVYRLKRRGLRA
jgi:two-component system, NtrC family, response regulator HydG